MCLSNVHALRAHSGQKPVLRNLTCSLLPCSCTLTLICIQKTLQLTTYGSKNPFKNARLDFFFTEIKSRRKRPDFTSSPNTMISLIFHCHSSNISLKNCKSKTWFSTSRSNHYCLFLVLKKIHLNDFRTLIYLKSFFFALFFYTDINIPS